MGIAGALLAMALPWVLGALAVLALERSLDGPDRAREGASAWALGAGYVVGILLLAGWMRALGFAGVRFSLATVALPLVIAIAAGGAWILRTKHHAVREHLRNVVALARGARMQGTLRWAWIALLAWLAIRFALLGLLVAWQPLYPWDAWSQWATKARVLYETGMLAPFVDAATFLSTVEPVWQDAAPGERITMPLVQAWMAIGIGRWDDAWINLPWWAFGVACALGVYGWLRREGLAPAGALLGAWLVTSLPLFETQIALAGYADLPLAVCFTLAVAASTSWARTRRKSDLALALFLVAGCSAIKHAGFAWALIAAFGAVVTMAGARAPRIGAGILAVVGFVALVLTNAAPVVGGMRLHLDYQGLWRTFATDALLMANWHLLALGIVAALAIGRRRLIAAPLLPLTLTIAAGATWITLLLAYPQLRAWGADILGLNRAMTTLAPAVVVWMVLVVRDRLELDLPAPAPAPAAAPAAQAT